MAEDAGAREATGEGTDEIEGVHLDSFAIKALGELATGRALEHQVKRLTMDRRPFGDDVGDQAAVVLWREVHLPAGGTADVDAVAPNVARDPDVEQVLERFPSNRWSERNR